jgi:predicted lipoprotein with Yx(FWY)xxD motif
MNHTKQRRASAHRIPVGLMAGSILAVGGLSALPIAAGTAGAATGVVVSTSKNAQVGTFLVSGKTVYTLKASNVPCTAQCLKVWPALLLPKGMTKATGGNGVNASKLGTAAGPGGRLQVTYAGKRLYWFIGDTAAGQVHGNITDKWGTWATVVTVKPTGSSSGSGSTTPSGGSSAGTGGVAF